MKKKNLLLATGVMATMAAGAVAGNKLKKKYENNDEIRKKLADYYHVLNKWLSIRQKGDSLVSYFVDRSYKSVAIYGYKEFGERLYDELRDSDVEVKYIIDKAADNIYAEVDCYLPDDILPDVDIVVVTASYYFDAIEEIMREKLDCPIVSIDDIVSYIGE